MQEPAGHVKGAIKQGFGLILDNQYFKRILLQIR